MEIVRLIGTEDVIRASREMRSAAESMLIASRNIDATFSAQRDFMDDWLRRFQGAMEGK